MLAGVHDLVLEFTLDEGALQAEGDVLIAGGRAQNGLGVSPQTGKAFSNPPDAVAGDSYHDADLASIVPCLLGRLFGL